MLKQWIVGKKKNHPAPSCRQFPRHGIMAFHHQYPFSDAFIIRRSNRLFAEYEQSRPPYELKTFGLPKLPFLGTEEPKQHVQSWCSVVCPQHLTTCCICKPVIIYCDHCEVSKQSSLYAKVKKPPVSKIGGNTAELKT